MDPRLATAAALAGVGDRPTAKGGISQENRPIFRSSRRRRPVLISLEAEK